MPATIEGLELASGEWINLYQAFNIPAGTVVTIHNIGSSDIYIASSSIKPEKDSLAYQRLTPGNIPMANSIGDTNIWGFSPNQGALVSVQIDGNSFLPVFTLSPEYNTGEQLDTLIKQNSAMLAMMSEFLQIMRLKSIRFEALGEAGIDESGL